MALVGYDLERRVAQPGETVSLTLYWRGLEAMETNYTVSTQFVDADQIKAAQDDSWPAGGGAPTTAWEPGQLVVDAHPMAINDVSPGVYDVRVTVYVHQDGEFTHLPVVSASGEMLASHTLLTRVRVNP